MATKDRVTIELYVDDQGTVKIRQARAEVEGLGKAGEQSFAGMTSSANDFASALLNKLAIYASLTAAAYQLGHAITSGFKQGIQAVDEFKLTTIGIAATMTDLAGAGVDSQKAYTQNIAYSRDMYDALELSAARHFASGKDLTQAFNILTQKGIVLRKEEIDDLGTIVDKIKLATQGQVQGIQIAQELRAMLSGQARATDQLAMLIKDRYGSAWEEVVKKQRESGNLIPWLAGEFKGLKYAAEDVQGTLTSQKTTLETLLTQVGRGGLSDAYFDIVQWLKQANNYLTIHREEIEGGIHRGWIAVKDLAEGTYGAIKDIVTVCASPITLTIDFSYQNADLLTRLFGGGQAGGTYTVTGGKYTGEHTVPATIAPSQTFGLGDLGASAAPDFQGQWEDQRRKTEGMAGEYGLSYDSYYDKIEKDTQAFKTRIQKQIGELGPVKDSLDSALGGISKIWQQHKYPGFETEIPGVERGAAPTKPLGKEDEGGKGGKGGGKGEDRMFTLVDNLNREIANLSQGSIGAIDAWYVKTLHDIEKLVGKGVDGAEAEALAYQAAGLKKEKVADDFTRLVAKEQGNAYAELDARYNDDLRKYQGLTGAKERLDEMWYKRKADLDDKFSKEALGLEKGYLDALAGASPFLTEQLALKERSLVIEAQMNKASLEKKLRELEINSIISAAQADEMRGLAALSEQAKKYALAREKWATEGIGGGIQIFALDLRQESEKAVALGVVAGLKGAKGLADDAITNLIMSPFTKNKMDFKKIGPDMATSLTKGLVSIGTTKLWSVFTKGAMGMVGTWAEAQASMTGATLAGDAARAASTAAGASQSMGILGALAQSTILMQAGQAAAGGFKSVMTSVPFPFNVVLAPIVAAAAFAATLAFGSGIGSGGGGGGGSFEAYPTGPQGVYHSGGIIAHDGWPRLAPDERHFIGLTGEGVLPRASMAKLGPSGFEALRRGNFDTASGGGPGGGGPRTVVIPLTINQVSPDGRVTGAQQYRLTVDLVNKGIKNREIRLPAPRRR